MAHNNKEIPHPEIKLETFITGRMVISDNFTHITEERTGFN